MPHILPSCLLFTYFAPMIDLIKLFISEHYPIMGDPIQYVSPDVLLAYRFEAEPSEWIAKWCEDIEDRFPVWCEYTWTELGLVLLTIRYLDSF